ncbi:hypothetical protein [Paenibacillus alvei]|uniref:hypothetical protein n=1 Tax=Paenibacillus alvei TaxID=44250 RepID=UPI0013DC6226|nr:hypothetical protein [Paenibacillus alvei]NEZ43336.1 hypothetical protein [Paenibacillus alvei]
MSKKSKMLDLYVQKKWEEFFDECCENRKMFYARFAILCDESTYLNTEFTDCLLDHEEEMFEAMGDMKKAFFMAFYLGLSFRMKEENEVKNNEIMNTATQ